jgi:hypothetical protein
MSKEINDGGPAFPCEGGEQSGLYAALGMSLRDWFAGQAVAGVGGFGYGSPTDSKGIAKGAYEIADAMLKARNPQ